ncbi:hypothetical protein SNEBB_005436 [Seison nebaliae]|nr:hypothetical protein SNEBB_005436 [Seison nebaliae]
MEEMYRNDNNVLTINKTHKDTASGDEKPNRCRILKKKESGTALLYATSNSSCLIPFSKKEVESLEQKNEVNDPDIINDYIEGESVRMANESNTTLKTFSESLNNLTDEVIQMEISDEDLPIPKKLEGPRDILMEKNEEEWSQMSEAISQMSIRAAANSVTIINHDDTSTEGNKGCNLKGKNCGTKKSKTVIEELFRKAKRIGRRNKGKKTNQVRSEKKVKERNSFLSLRKAVPRTNLTFDDGLTNDVENLLEENKSINYFIGQASLLKEDYADTNNNNNQIRKNKKLNKNKNNNNNKNHSNKVINRHINNYKSSKSNYPITEKRHQKLSSQKEHVIPNPYEEFDELHNLSYPGLTVYEKHKRRSKSPVPLQNNDKKHPFTTYMPKARYEKLVEDTSDKGTTNESFTKILMAKKKEYEKREKPKKLLIQASPQKPEFKSKHLKETERNGSSLNTNTKQSKRSKTTKKNIKRDSNELNENHQLFISEDTTDVNQNANEKQEPTTFLPKTQSVSVISDVTTIKPEIISTKKPTGNKSINFYENLIKGLAGQELEECTECFSEDIKGILAMKKISNTMILGRYLVTAQNQPDVRFLQWLKLITDYRIEAVEINNLISRLRLWTQRHF